MTTRGRITVAIIATAALATGLAGCSTDKRGDSSSPPKPTPSVPVSANVTPPPGPVERTPTGTTLRFSQPAYLPANAFRTGGQLAMFTVTGIDPGSSSDLPSSLLHGGDPYYVHVTMTELANKTVDIPSVVGLAGSADGRTPTRTVSPPSNFTKCAENAAPKKLARGESFASCFVAVADPDQKLTSVIYWADTDSDDSVNYKAQPVVWGTPTPPTGASAAPST